MSLALSLSSHRFTLQSCIKIILKKQALNTRWIFFSILASNTFSSTEDKTVLAHYQSHVFLIEQTMKTFPAVLFESEKQRAVVDAPYNTELMCEFLKASIT